MKNILLITPAFRPNLGGVEVHLNDLTNYLSTHGYFTYVLTYQPITTKAKGLGVEISPNLEIHRYSWISGNYFNVFVNLHPIFNFLYLTPYLFIRSFFFMLVNNRKVDVIHAIGLSSAFSARILKILFNKPVVMSTETLFNFKEKTLFFTISRWLLSGLDGILAQSYDSKKELVSLGLDPKKIKIFSHWIDQEKFKPSLKKAALRKKLGWQNVFTALYVGRLIPEKGIRLVLETLSKISQKISLKIVGDDGPELNAVLSATKHFPNIHFLGKIPHDDLPPIYSASDVMIYPALYKEDMAYSILDSLSCGTPVIVTNPGSGAYRLPEKVAFLVHPEVNEIVDKVNYLITHPDVAQDMSEQSARFAKKFGPRLAKVITTMYDSIYVGQKTA